MTVRERINKVIVGQGANVNGLKPETSFIGDLVFDSLDMVEVTFALEEEFKIFIPDEDIDDIDTVGQLYEYIERKVKEGGDKCMQ